MCLCTAPSTPSPSSDLSVSLTLPFFVVLPLSASCVFSFSFSFSLERTNTLTSEHTSKCVCVYFLARSLSHAQEAAEQKQKEDAEKKQKEKKERKRIEREGQKKQDQEEAKRKQETDREKNTHKEEEERQKRELNDRKTRKVQEKIAQDIESVQTVAMMQVVAMKNRTKVKRRGDGQGVGAASASGVLLLEAVVAVEPTPAPQQTTGFRGGGDAWSMIQDGGCSEAQQSVVEVCNVARGGGGGQGVSAATASSVLVLEAAAAKGPALSAPQLTTRFSRGGGVWNMMQGRVGFEGQQWAVEMNGAASGGGGGGSGLDTGRLLPAPALSAETMAPTAAAAVAPAPAPVKGRVTCFTYQSLSRATNNFDKRLGSGGFGSVFQGVLMSGTHVAVKRLEIDPNLGLLHLDQNCQMKTEVQVLSQIQHPNVVQLLGSSTDGASPCLVYALMEGGSLQDRLACITGQVPLTANERILVLSDVARGLSFLHSEAKVIHRDVKVIHRNVLKNNTSLPASTTKALRQTEKQCVLIKPLFHFNGRFLKQGGPPLYAVRSKRRAPNTRHMHSHKHMVTHINTHSHAYTHCLSHKHTVSLSHTHTR